MTVIIMFGENQINHGLGLELDNPFVFLCKN